MASANTFVIFQELKNVYKIIFMNFETKPIVEASGNIYADINNIALNLLKNLIFYELSTFN